MELTIKLTEEMLKQPGVYDAVLQILGSREPGKKKPETPEAKPEEPEAPEVKPEKPTDFKALRSKVRTLGGELAKDEKSTEMIEVFKSFGAAKLSEIKDEDLEAVIAKLEVL